MSDIKEEVIQETVNETIVEESTVEKDIYEAQGYAAIPMEEPEDRDEEEGGYFESGYMTLPDEDPDEDKRTIEYPENYEEIADLQLKILEQQYQAVLSGSTIPGDDPFEVRKPAAAMLPTPMDVVGDEEVPRSSKKTKSGKKKAAKKTWSREEILNTFLPPEKQKALQKSRRGKEVSEPQKPKKAVPKVVIKEPVETKQPLNDEKANLIRSTMNSIQMDHTPSWAQSIVGYM